MWQRYLLGIQLFLSRSKMTECQFKIADLYSSKNTLLLLYGNLVVLVQCKIVPLFSFCCKFEMPTTICFTSWQTSHFDNKHPRCQHVMYKALKFSLSDMAPYMLKITAQSNCNNEQLNKNISQPFIYQHILLSRKKKWHRYLYYRIHERCDYRTKLWLFS